ncbi:MAG: CoA transferase, partial [Chloroflexi bacterium]|nr:CoA transferase [Chloroflexota bacterium]
MLSRYRVLDLADEKGQLCGRILADLGADVVKIEPPGGDPARGLGPFLHDTKDPEKSLSWYALNANKRGITLDLETEADQATLRRLAGEADFLVESFPPGHLDRLGLGYEALSGPNPRLIVISISPTGQEGPRARWATSDIVSMAMSGIMSVAGDPDRAPVRISEPQAYLH